MRTFSGANIQNAIVNQWTGRVLLATFLPWNVPVVSLDHPKAARGPVPFLAHLVTFEGLKAGGLFWFKPELAPEQRKGDLVRGDVVEWRGNVRTFGPAALDGIAGLVGSNGQAWLWSGPFTVESGEELAIVGTWT